MTETVELKDYLHVIRVRKWIIIAAVVVVTATAVVVSLLQPNVYQSEAKVLVTAQDAGSALLGSSLSELSGQPERGLQTQVQLIQLRTIAERVIRQLGLRTTPDSLLGRVTVSAVGQTNLVTIVVTDATPKLAADTAQTFATAYVEWSRDLKRASITAAADEVQTRLDEAKQEILTLGGKLKGGNSGALQADLRDATSEQATLIETLVGLRVDEQNETHPAQLASIRSKIASTERQLSDVRAKIIDLGSRLGSAGDATKNYDVQAELQIATGLYTTLAEKYETLKVQEQLEVGSGSVVEAAAIDTVAVSPKPLRNGALGLAVGLVFGLGMAFLAEYLDNTIKSAEEAQELFGAPVLGNIPAVQFKEGEPRRLTIVQDPGSRGAEAYRGLRNSIDYVNFEHDIKTVLVTSAAPGEGKSTVSANLAAGLAMAGAKVVLLNCDFRRPTTDQFFEVNNQLGLSDVLAGRVSLDSALQHTGDENLRVLTPGKMPPNPSELLGSQKMTELIETIRAGADWIIVDSPPLLAVADAAATARWTDGVLVVTRAGVSTHPAAANARDILDKVGARILGIVVWGLDESRGGRGGYGGYGYGGYYGGYYSEYYGGATNGGSKSGDSGARSMLGVEPARHRAREFTMPEERGALGRLPAWLSGWKLGLAVFVSVVLLLCAVLLLLNGLLGWFAF
jgi:capsular exopolysaccharide synthesis family protein